MKRSREFRGLIDSGFPQLLEQAASMPCRKFNIAPKKISFAGRL
jgi:hypothetical protein